MPAMNRADRRPRVPRLSDSARSELFRGLARLMAAGLSVERALVALKGTGDSGIDAALDRMAVLVAGGRTVADAAAAASVMTAGDVAALRCAERAGTLVETADSLADCYAARSSCRRKLRSRMLLPAMVLAMGLLAQPVPELYAGSISVSDYLARSLLPLALVVAGAWGLGQLWRRGGETAFITGLGRVMALIPMLAANTREVARLEFLEGLEMLLRAGVPASEAARSALERVRNSAYRSRFGETLTALKTGASVAGALRASAILDGQGDYPLVSSGEVAGRLVDSLAHRVEFYRDRIQSRYDLVAEWLPRLVYFLVLAFLAMGYLV